MNSNASLDNVLTPTPAGVWVPVALFAEFLGVGVMEAADNGEGVSVQLRKATDAAGSNATDHGTAATVTSTAADVDVVATQNGRSDQLGKTAGGLDFTHVQALVSAVGSPAPAEGVYGILIRGKGRFNP